MTDLHTEPAARSVPANATAMATGARSLTSRTWFWIAIIDIALVILFGFLSPDYAFFDIESFKNVAADSSEALLLTTAVALSMSAGELDISLGANLILSSVIGGKVMLALAGSGIGVAIVVGILACVATGAVIGLANGLVVARMRVNSLITTLAATGIATGIALLITDGADLAGLPENLQSGFGNRAVLDVLPLPAFVALVFFGLAWFAVAKTRPGVHLLAMGSSRDSALRSGLHVTSILIILFIVMGALAGVAALIDLSRFGTTNVAGHQADALAALGAAVIGGTSLYGGTISMPGALLGTLLAVILQDGLVVVGLSPFYQLIATGVVLVMAVWLDQRRKPRQ